MQDLLNKYIFTPGPVRMYEETLQLGSVQTPYFRNEEFSEVILECEQDLLQLLNAPKASRVVFLTASGTAGMEATVQNLLNKNDKTIVINGGGFGQRFVELCKLHNIKHLNHKLTGDDLSNTTPLNNYSSATTLLINAHETSIGLLYNMKSVGKFCKKNNILNIVDAISLFVTDELDMQKQNIDALIISSHKGLALPPGLAMVVLSPKAIQKINPPNFMYFDFNRYINNGKRGQTPFTPAVTILLQLQARLKQIKKDGILFHIDKAKNIADYFRKQICILPIKEYSHSMPNAMTTLAPTDGRSAYDIVRDLDQKFNIIVAPNGGDLRNIIFRVSHMGNMDRDYINVLINALYQYYGVERKLP